HEHHQLGRAQAELGALTTRLGPASEAGRCELDSDTRGGRYAHFIRDLQQYVQLAQLLEDDEHPMPELLSHECQSNELMVLVAVADDQVVGVCIQSKHSLKLRLGAAFEANTVLASGVGNLLDHVALLVHLDRV